MVVRRKRATFQQVLAYRASDRWVRRDERALRASDGTEVGRAWLPAREQSRIGDPVCESTEQSDAEGLIVVAGVLTYVKGKEIGELALAYRLPSCHAFYETVRAGGLVSLGPDIPAMAQQGAVYIDKIIHGAKPADLPVQQPAKYLLTVNLKTAKALGLTIPLPLIARADEVIE